jgi:hypothetical protein
MLQYSSTRKEAKMTVGNKTYQVGDLFTTLKSKETGVIKEIIPNSSGSVRVRLETDNGERWTTVLADNLA